ncbi:glycosyl hydrolase family 28-related protein [Actinoplanes sp. NPDC051343]|uniref:glycosyl hydrolase family 28-related protein n=1 Tax=Actinoplanes sp. NPDC051343 TaxID=3363906 RepID=UPI0037B8DE79
MSALAFGASLVAATSASAAGTFNIRDYGATGNGLSNDSAAIQKAVDAASAAGGGTVRVPSGTHTGADGLRGRPAPRGGRPDRGALPAVPRPDQGAT